MEWVELQQRLRDLIADQLGLTDPEREPVDEGDVYMLAGRISDFIAANFTGVEMTPPNTPSEIPPDTN